MRYKKTSLSFGEQLHSLKDRGLKVFDDEKAIQTLSVISYYRLRAYTYPFQNNNDPKHPFVREVSFEQIYNLYTFDGRLRKLLFRALEKIEIALRTQIIYQFAKSYGSHWQLNPLLYRDTARFARHLDSLNREIDRSQETFIKHYKKKYDQPEQPPCWMSLEVASFGTLSKIFKNLKAGKEKDQVAEYFKLKDIRTLENWMFCFSILRNACAHHSRLWNKRLNALPFLPYNSPNPFMQKKETKQIYRNKIYAVICCMYYILKVIEPDNSFKDDLIDLMESCPFKQESEMGFPKDWLKQGVWQ